MSNILFLEFPTHLTRLLVRWMGDVGHGDEGTTDDVKRPEESPTCNTSSSSLTSFHLGLQHSSYSVCWPGLQQHICRRINIKTSHRRRRREKYSKSGKIFLNFQWKMAAERRNYSSSFTVRCSLYCHIWLTWYMWWLGESICFGTRLTSAFSFTP